MDNPYSPPKADISVPIPAQGLPLASRGARFGGVILDRLLESVVLLPALFIYFGSLKEYTQQFQERSLIFSAVVLSASLVVWLALNGYLIHTRGQTIGKVLVGTRIVRRDGSPVTLGRVFGLRVLPLQLMAWIPIFGGLIGLADALMIFRQNRACLHDDFADTMVVEAGARVS
jgi:uncharacterized RDD family membrane protein YckC